MKKYEVDLADYTFEGRDGTNQTAVLTVSVKEELAALLRVNGIYDTGIELCDGADLAKQIKDCDADTLELSETEVKLLQKVLNKLIQAENEQMRLGGIRYEEMILRVFRPKEA